MTLNSGNSMALGGLMAGTRQPASRQASAPKLDDASEAFLAEAKKSPIERIQDSILKKHNLTKEAFEQLPASEQASIQKEIEDTVKQWTKGAKPGAAPTGMNANVLA
ncbi:hypothetical protein [Sphingomonas sp. dw_22]|uniref:hypothetical protein n=1 Tax=Sphingomonas sp. dw_22 TaxID=2721175 RepID=UPI001BD4A1B8|nr:hypothetical protein [Sphingomonas sp. dw_22]